MYVFRADLREDYLVLFAPQEAPPSKENETGEPNLAKTTLNTEKTLLLDNFPI